MLQKGNSTRVPRPLKSRRGGKKSKKAPRYRPAEKLTREMIRLQKTEDWMIPHAPFTRLVRQIMADIVSTKELRYQRAALRALHEATEAYLVGLLEDAYLCSLLARRVTLMVKDVRLAYKIRGDFDRYGI